VLAHLNADDVKAIQDSARALIAAMDALTNFEP
jgi:hypothetical protein